MNRFLLYFIGFALFSTLCSAQTLQNKKEKSVGFRESSFGEDKSSIRFITVTGTAEKEVTPDIIYLSLTLKEYYLDKENRNKIFIDDLERNFQRIALDNGIPSENISIEAISGFTRLSQRKKNEGFLASKSYKIKLSDLDKINSLLDKIDPKALSSVYISGYDFSQIEQVKKELRIKAMIDAKSKATYCLAAVDESLGNLLETEIDETFQNQVGPNLFGLARGLSLNSQEVSVNTDSIDFKKIKLSASVRVKFQIR